MRTFLSLLFLGALAAPQAAAQSSYSFDVDGPTSNFTFGGNSSLGRIVGKPGRFDMDGTIDMQLSSTSSGFSTGEFTGGLLFTVPSRITAEIPNVFSFLPPLATIHIDNAQYSGTTPSFAVDASGNFSTDIVMTPVGGTVTVIPLVGSTEVSNLADYGPTDPTPVSGNVMQTAAGGATLTMPVDLQFIDDDGMGNFVILDLDGVLNASSSGPHDMSLSTAAPVVAGTSATFDAAGGAAGTATFLAYGLNPGSTPVPPLGITLDLAGAQQIGTTVVSDGGGNASFPVAIPPVAAGVVAYLQACQTGMRSNLLTVVIQ